MTANPHRLSRSVQPIHYQLVLEPDLGAATFGGAQDIRIAVNEPVNEIVLNAVDLLVEEAWLIVDSGERLELVVDVDPATERLTLRSDRVLTVGTHHLHTQFRGELNDKLRGFYRSTFKDHEGHERTIATTQFESTNARRAFPCWDEPDFKATFGVTLTIDPNLFAVSCSSEKGRTTRPDGLVEVAFADTMVMSTYLVAFVVGPLEATAAVNVNGTPLRVVHPLGQAHLTAFALDVGTFCLRYFEDYFGIAYPGDKLDLVAVPDFAFGAMENLGCVTFREVLLLIDPLAATQPELQRAADVIAHEIAHMWFGDLVTMAWWEGLWLKEAFATFMEMKATDAYRPDWCRWVDFGQSKSAAFDTDALESTRAIEYEVVSPADAEGMYDILTYEKGAAVVRMLEQYLGEDAFRRGVQLYLTRHAYANTRTTDLWDALEEATGQPVRAVMDSWIFQGGFPMVSGELAAGRLTISQEQFRYRDAGPNRFGVPIIVDAVRGAHRETHRLLLETTQTELDLNGADAVVLNAGAHGFYRSRYLGTGLQTLTAVAQELLSPVERYTLIDDAYAAMLAGHVHATDVLALCRNLAGDDDLTVWQRIAGALGGLARLLDQDELAPFQAAVRELCVPALDIAGWESAEGETDRERELRAALFALAGTTGDDASIGERAATLHRLGTTDPSLGAAAVAVLAHRGASTDWSDFRRRLESSTTPQELRRYTFALADFPAWGLTQSALELCLDGAIKSQDGAFVVARALANRTVAASAWAWVEANWDALNTRLPTNTISRLLATITTITDPSLAGAVDAFLDAHPIPQGAKTVRQNREKMQVMVALAARERALLADSLR